MTTALTAAAPAGAASLNGPPPLPRPYSLLESASAPEVMVVTDERAAAGGVDFWAYSRDVPRLWEPCLTGTLAEKDLAFDNTTAPSSPFTVYLPVGCSAIDATQQELEERVRAVFEATESFGVEQQLVRGDVTTTPRYLGDSNVAIIDPGNAEPPATALALLEQQIGTTGRRGVIHADPGVVTTWAPYLIDIGGVLRTVANGTLVVAGAGYSFTTPQGGTAVTTQTAWAYASGPVFIVRGDIQVLFAYDHSINDALAIAERNYVVTWDGALQSAVLIDLTP